MKITMARLTIMASLAVPVFVAAACKEVDDGGDSKAGKGPGLDIGGNVTLATGEHVELTATMRDEDGTPSVVTKDPQTVWSITNSTIASIVGGVVTGVAPGTTTVQASFNGTHSPARTVTVKK